MGTFKGRIDFHIHEAFKLRNDGLLKEHCKCTEELVQKNQFNVHNGFTQIVITFINEKAKTIFLEVDEILRFFKNV